MTAAPLAALDPQGPVAATMADLWWFMLWLGTAVLVVFLAALGIGLARRGREAIHPGEEDTSRRVGRLFVALGVVVPLLLILVTFGATVQAMRAIPDEAPADALVVDIVGHRWWYEVVYPDHDVSTANELYLPVGRPVALRLTSADVIHSVWIPSLAGKLDLLPEDTNTLVLTADEPGEHLTQCAEFCGLQHANMRLLVVVEEPEAFEAWIAERRRGAPEPTSESAQRGQDVFMANCAECHTIRGTPAEGRDGPELTHLASRATLGAGTLPHTREALEGWIRDPHVAKQGVEMPAAELDDDQLGALLDYLETLE